MDIGTNWLTLSVSDGHDTVFQPFEVQVLSAGEAVGELIGIVQGLASHSGMKPNGLKQLLEPLDAARSEFDKGLWNAGIVHITIFQSRVWAQIGTSDEAMANNLIRAAQQILDALKGNARNQPKLGLIQNRSGNRKSVTFSGSPGQIYLVQACSDLQHYLQHWETIGIAVKRIRAISNSTTEAPMLQRDITGWLCHSPIL